MTTAAPADTPAGEPAPAETAAPAQPEGDIANQALGLIKAINENWDELSNKQQDTACEIVYNFMADLEASASDDQREMGAERFLDTIASNPALAAKLPVVVRRGTETSTWDQVFQAVENSPGLANLGRELAAAEPQSSFSLGAGGWVAANGGGAPAPAGDDAPEKPSETAPYFTDVRFPEQVSTFDRAVPLMVRLTVEKPKESRVVEGVDVEFEREEEIITVVCFAEDFEEAYNDLTRTITVVKGRDSQPAVFLLSPKRTASAGAKRIALDFVHHGRNIGTASFTTQIIDRPSEPSNEPAKSISEEARLEISQLRTYEAEPVDLELRVTLGANKTQLMYMLHSPKGTVGYHWTPAGSVQLDDEPRLFLQATINRLNRMARKGADGLTEAQVADYKDALDRIGHDLYDQIFSDELKREYAGRISKLRKDGAISNLLITSDEPWIPWEILKPYQTDIQSGEVLVDDDFLCSEFRLSRWLAGRGVPDFVTVSSARLVAPPSNLNAVQREIAYFETTLPARLHVPAELPLETAAQVLDALADRAGNLYHFSCHGNFDADNADESPLQLKDGEILAPSDVTGPYETGVVQSKPLVFLNACYAGQVGRNIRGLGGWAQRFVGKGASAFIGGLWEVNDNLAAEFAITFYNALWDGATLGEAIHSARTHLRELNPANPTWLAYTLYADPNGIAKTPADA
ncbi:MAG: CHAT domain-containing protein [Caldilineales bacterium]